MAIAYTRKTDRVTVWHADDPAYEQAGGGDLSGVVVQTDYAAPAGVTLFELRPLNSAERIRSMIRDGQGEALHAAIVSVSVDGQTLSADERRDLIDGMPVHIALDLFTACAAVTDGPFLKARSR